MCASLASYAADTGHVAIGDLCARYSQSSSFLWIFTPLGSSGIQLEDQV